MGVNWCSFVFHSFFMWVSFIFHVFNERSEYNQWHGLSPLHDDYLGQLLRGLFLDDHFTRRASHVLRAMPVKKMMMFVCLFVKKSKKRQEKDRKKKKNQASFCFVYQKIKPPPPHGTHQHVSAQAGMFTSLVLS
jgi:hypothetical protein